MKIHNKQCEAINNLRW